MIHWDWVFTAVLAVPGVLITYGLFIMAVEKIKKWYYRWKYLKK